MTEMNDDFDDFEDMILHKVDNGIKLTKGEVAELVFDGYEIEREDCDEQRWTMSTRSIVKLKDRFFSLDWERGLTENQPNDFSDSQPYEVKPVEKTITITEYVPI